LLTRDWAASREVLADLGVMTAGELALARGLNEPFVALRHLLTTLPQEGLARVTAALEEKLGIDTGRLDGLKPLTWSMLAEMQRGGITVGSHTRTHALLTHESPPRMLEETVGARRTLQDRLGVRIEHFAYPDGAFDTQTVEAVAQAGYRFGYTTCHHRDRRHPLLTIPRCVLWENSCLDPAGRFSGAVASCVTTGIFHFASGCRHRHAVVSRPAAPIVRRCARPASSPFPRRIRTGGGPSPRPLVRPPTSGPARRSWRKRRARRWPSGRSSGSRSCC